MKKYKTANRKLKEDLRMSEGKLILELLEDKKDSLLNDEDLSEEEKFRVNYVFNYFTKNPERIMEVSKGIFGEQYGENAKYLIRFMEGFD